MTKEISISFKNALNGFKQLIKEERNARIELSVSILAILLGLILRLNKLEWVLLLLTMALVIFTEIINTIVERICDVIQPEKDQRIKFIKDMAAASVLCTVVVAAIIGCILFANKILALCLP